MTSRTITQPCSTGSAVENPLYCAKAIRTLNTSKINLPRNSAIIPSTNETPLQTKLIMPASLQTPVGAV
ncbi:MAG TPA: hypothetical protein PLR08_01110 [bacterium]|nr:hypothetical protein [bacterium]